MHFASSDKPDALDYEGVRRVARKNDADDDSSGWDKFRKRARGLANAADDNGAAVETAKPFDANHANLRLGKRGHAITFAGFFLFTVVLYFRPYELIPALSGLLQMAFYIGLFTLIAYLISQIIAEGNITAPLREVKLVALLGLLALLSIPLAIDPGEAWGDFSEILIKALLMFIVLVNVVRTRTRMMMLMLVAIAVSIYLSVNAISDYRNGVFIIGKADLARIGGSIGGLFKNSNDLALHLVTMVPIAVCLGLTTKGPLRKIIYWGAAGLMAAATVVTFSRGGFLGLIGVTLLFAYKFGKRNKPVTIAVLALTFILFIGLAPGSYGDRLGTIFDSASDLSGSSSQRTQVLKRSIVVALRYPLTGVGIGNFHHKSFQELGTHNAYTQVAAEIGIPAFVVYVMFLLYPLKRLRQIEKTAGEHKDKENRWFFFMSIGLQGAIVGYMVSSFFGAVAYQWYVYYLVGYAICLHRMFLVKTPSLAHVSWEKPFTRETKRAEKQAKAKLINQPTMARTSQV